MATVTLKSPFSTWAKPLACLLGLHKWKWHPSSDLLHQGRYCVRCHTEKWHHS